VQAGVAEDGERGSDNVKDLPRQEGGVERDFETRERLERCCQQAEGCSGEAGADRGRRTEPNEPTVIGLGTSNVPSFCSSPHKPLREVGMHSQQPQGSGCTTTVCIASPSAMGREEP
jgi:hypothetical protein